MRTNKANTIKQKIMRARPGLIKDYSLVVLPSAVVMLLLLQYSVLSSIIFGLFILHIPVFNAYVWNVISVVIAGGILWAVYAILKVKNPIHPAVIISVLSTTVFMALRAIPVNSLVLFFIFVAVACVGYFVATHIKKKLIFWCFIVAVLLFNILLVPWIASYIDHELYADKTSKQLQEARNELDFTVYTPGYVPRGMKASAPELFGINDKFIRLHVEYIIGGIEVRQSERLDGQEQLINFTDNCDIRTLWSVITDHDGVTARDIDKSRSDLSKCNLVATTDSGRKIYFQQRGQWAWFYTEIGNTITLFEFDSTNRDKYEESFLPELVKIINSLEPVSKELIEFGRH